MRCCWLTEVLYLQLHVIILFKNFNGFFVYIFVIPVHSTFFMYIYNVYIYKQYKPILNGLAIMYNIKLWLVKSFGHKFYFNLT